MRRRGHTEETIHKGHFSTLGGEYRKGSVNKVATKHNIFERREEQLSWSAERPLISHSVYSVYTYVYAMRGGVRCLECELYVYFF